jgi:hypothetical protein
MLMDNVDWNDKTFDNQPAGATLIISTMLIVAFIGWISIIL